MVNINTDFQQPNIHFQCPADHYCDSGVNDSHMIKAGAWSAGYDTGLQTLMTAFFENERTNGGLFHQFGWRDYGDHQHSSVFNQTRADGKVIRFAQYMNDTHYGAKKWMHNYYRALHLNDFEFAEIASRHFMDISIGHGLRQGYNYGDGLSALNTIAGEPMNYPAGHRQKDHCGRNCHAGHAHLSALGDMYVMTGNRLYYEQMSLCAEWLRNFITLRMFTPLLEDTYFDEARNEGCLMECMSYAWNYTGEIKYLQALADAVKWVVHMARRPNQLVTKTSAGESYQGHWQNNAQVGNLDFTAGSGFLAGYLKDCGHQVYPKTSNTGCGWNGAQPWQHGIIFHNCMKFIEYDADYNLLTTRVGSSEEELLHILLQCYKHMIKFAYWPPGKDIAGLGEFTYTEKNVPVGTPGWVGASGLTLQHDGRLAYGLWWLHRKFFLEGKPTTNRNWYTDTDNTGHVPFNMTEWKNLALNAYNVLKTTPTHTVAQAQSSPYYGYAQWVPSFFGMAREYELSPWD